MVEPPFPKIPTSRWNSGLQGCKKQWWYTITFSQQSVNIVRPDFCWLRDLVDLYASMQLQILRRLWNLDEHPICKCDNQPQLVTMPQSHLKWKPHNYFWHGKVYRLLRTIFKKIRAQMPNANIYIYIFLYLYIYIYINKAGKLSRWKKKYFIDDHTTLCRFVSSGSNAVFCTLVDWDCDS